MKFIWNTRTSVSQQYTMIIKHNSIILSVNTKFAFNRFFGKYSVYLEKNNKKNWVNRKNLICWLAFGKLDVTSRIEYWWCSNLCPLIHGEYSFQQLAIGGLIAESVVLNFCNCWRLDYWAFSSFNIGVTLL